MLYCSKSRVENIEEKMKIRRELRGGRLTYFMIYDLVAFIISFALGCIKYNNGFLI